MLYSKRQFSRCHDNYDYPSDYRIPTDDLYSKLATLGYTKQWILFTAQATRPTLYQLTSHRIPPHHVVQIKNSQTQSEFEVACKAIKSGNARAIVLSNQFKMAEKQQLEQLALIHQCDLFFDKGSKHKYH